MKTQPLVGQYECQRFAAIAFQVSEGLKLVIREGSLPAYYREVFRSAVMLCEDIVEGAYPLHTDCCSPYCSQVTEMSNSTFLFSNITRSHPETYEKFTTYGDVLDICDTLDFLSREEASPRAYPDERIIAIQEFFLSLWGAVAAERLKEGIDSEIDFSAFPAVSMLYQ